MKVWWTHMEQLWGLWDLDAQAVFPLSTGEGQKKTGKRPTREPQQPCTCIKINKHWMQA